MNITLDDGRTELWQWDTGRKIVVDDKSVSEVHYSKYSSTQAITREVIDGKAEIPNFLLQDTHAVTVYAYSGSIENGYTVAEKTFNVVKKPKPANYVETEEDKAILAKLKAAIGDLSELQTEAKDSLVSAINEAAASGGADWSQNDPDGDGYVKNRPGGYMTDPVITDVGTFTITSAEDIGGLYMAEVAVESSAITLSDYVIGDGVIVDFGGQSYSLTWQSMEDFPACGAAVTGEAIDWSAAPFCIIAVFGGDGGLRGYYVYLQNAVTSPIQVKIKKVKQTPIKIPEKYLELDSAKEIVLFTISYNRSDDTYVSDQTYEELATALNSGKLVVAKFGNVGMGELYSYGLLCQAGMYVAGLYVYAPSYQPYRWYCTKGNVWTKRRLLNLEMEIEAPFYEQDVGNVLTQVKSSGEYYKYKYAPKSIAGYGVKYIAEGYIGGNNEFICTTSSEEVIRRCGEIDNGCLCAIRIIDEDSYTIAIAEGGLCGDKGMTFSRVYTDGRGNLYTLCCSLNIESDTVSWSTYKHENITNNYATKEYVDNKEVVVNSSTEGSTKKFKITVDDTGALSAVEVTT